MYDCNSQLLVTEGGKFIGYFPLDHLLGSTIRTQSSPSTASGTLPNLPTNSRTDPTSTTSSSRVDGRIGRRTLMTAAENCDTQEVHSVQSPITQALKVNIATGGWRILVVGAHHSPGSKPVEDAKPCGCRVCVQTSHTGGFKPRSLRDRPERHIWASIPAVRVREWSGLPNELMEI